MARDRIWEVRVHPAPPPGGDAPADGINQTYARYVRRWLEESGLSPAAQDAALQELIAQLRDRPS